MTITNFVQKLDKNKTFHKKYLLNNQIEEDITDMPKSLLINADLIKQLYEYELYLYIIYNNNLSFIVS